MYRSPCSNFLERPTRFGSGGGGPALLEGLGRGTSAVYPPKLGLLRTRSGPFIANKRAYARLPSS
jgi:hypothetical protein